MLSPDMAEDLTGKPLQDDTGEVVGDIEEVFPNRGDDTPAWAAVNAGAPSVVVPLVGAAPTGDGGVKVGFHRDAILEAPAPAASGLDNDAQKALWAHYGISD